MVIKNSTNKVEKINDIQFKNWVSLIEERTGIIFKESRRSFIETNICLGMKSKKMTDYDSYYDFIKENEE